ncbi:MAG: AraC family transcriptional regulator [Bacteroidetes bacterium]|nr:AraC family transcriptional regulator [Bacteroidota bacterium]
MNIFIRNKQQLLFLKFYTPHPLLQPVVNIIMLFAEQFAENVSMTAIPYPPLPEQSLFFYPRSPITATIHGTDKTVINPNSIIVGPQLQRVNIVLGHDHIVIRVGFKPGGLHRLIGMPMHEMVDEACNTADFFHRQVQRVNEQLFNTEGYDEMITVVQQFLLNKISSLKTALPFDHAMSLLIQSDGLIPVEKIASTACVSTRQLERQCKVRIGLPPKLFARLIRFSKAYRLFESSPSLSWTHIAHQCGYFDQMHFIRDCKDFAGVNPSVIAKEVRGAPAQLQFMLQI